MTMLPANRMPSNWAGCALAMVLAVVGHARAAQNYARDPSFEDGTATMAGGARLVAPGRTGARAARIERATETETPSVVLPAIPLRAGRYRLSAWLRGRITRGADRNFSVELNAVWLDADGREIGRSRGPSASGALPVWEYREAVVAGPDGARECRLEFGFTGAVVGFCEIDDIFLDSSVEEGTGREIPRVVCRPSGPIVAIGEPHSLSVALPASLGRAAKVLCRTLVRDSLGNPVGEGQAGGEIPATWRTVVPVPLSIPDERRLAGEWLSAETEILDAASREVIAAGSCGLLLLDRPTDFRPKPDSPFALLVGHPYTKRWLGARWDRPNLCNARLLEVAQRYGVSRMPLLEAPHERIEEPGVAEAFRQTVTEYVRENARYLDYLQVGNEPPLFRPGVTERYVKCLRIAYEAAKAEKPAIQIASAGITGLDIDEEMVARMLAAGAARYCDLIDIHTYLSLGEMDRIVGKVRQQMAERGVDKPLILTEVTANLGSPIPERAKAGHVYQRYAIALSHGVRQIYWFVLHWVNDLPGGFGYCGLLDAGTHAPWPAAAAYARLAAVLEDRPFEARLGTESPGAWVYAFKGPQDRAVVAWADRNGLAVRLEGEAPRVAVYDVNGRLLVQETKGEWMCELTDEPILIHGGQARVSVVEIPATGQSMAARGARVSVPLPGLAPVPPPRLACGFSMVSSEAEEAALAVAPDAALGRTEAWFAGESLLRRAVLTVVDPLELTVTPAFVAARPAFRVTVRNCGGETVSGEVRVASPFTRHFRPEILDGSFADLRTGESRDVVLPVDGPCDPLHGATVRATATTTGGARAEWTRRISFLAAPRWRNNAWSDARPIRIGPLAVARRDAPGSDPDRPGDLSAVAAVAWDETSLRLLVEVADDVHRNDRQDGSIWDGDSIQIGIAKAPGREGADHCEISVGLGASGPQAWVHRSFPGCPTGPAVFPAAVRREGTRTLYEVAIPWSSLGLRDAQAGMWLGLGLVLNEADEGPRGWLGWHAGIATDKNPALYGQIVLTE